MFFDAAESKFNTHTILGWMPQEDTSSSVPRVHVLSRCKKTCIRRKWQYPPPAEKSLLCCVYWKIAKGPKRKLMCEGSSTRLEAICNQKPLNCSPADLHTIAGMPVHCNCRVALALGDECVRKNADAIHESSQGVATD